MLFAVGRPVRPGDGTLRVFGSQVGWPIGSGAGAPIGADARVASMSAPCEYWPKPLDSVYVRKYRDALPVPPKAPVAHDTFDDLPTGPKPNPPAADCASRNAPVRRRVHHGRLAMDSPCSDERRPYEAAGRPPITERNRLVDRR